MPSSSETVVMPQTQQSNNHLENDINVIEEKVDAILNKYDRNKNSLISILLDIQSEYNYLPKNALILVSEKLNIRLIEIYTVATFYTVFSLKPRGKYIINVCVGTACHVRGGQVIADNIQKELNIKIGDTTDNMLFTLETVRCLGACALGPVMEINGEYYGQLTTKKADSVLQTYKTKEAGA